jgi:uncharacterized membrane protein
MTTGRRGRVSRCAITTAALAVVMAGAVAAPAAAQQPPLATADVAQPLTTRGYVLDNGKRGSFTTIEPPTAVATKLGDINSRGEIVGGFSDGAAVHNFVRDRRGRYTTFDPPGSGGIAVGTQDINDRGEVAGWYIDVEGTIRAFVRDRSGRFTPIAHPDASGTSPYGPGTAVYGIDNRGEMVGAYAAGGKAHGFVRDRRGVFTTVDYPGAVDTQLLEINERGQAVGSYSDAPGGLDTAPRNFILDRARRDYTPVNVPGATYATADDINNRGEVVGLSIDTAGIAHGFYRDRRGRTTTVDHPDAAPLGSAAGGLDDRGRIVGEFYDEEPVEAEATSKAGNARRGLMRSNLVELYGT